MKTIPAYLDYAASAPVSESVVQAMMPYLRGGFGNASSTHAAGRRARHAVEEARASIAGLLGARSEEIVFTSGGTESDYMAVSGFTGQGRLVTCQTEHDAVLGAFQALSRSGRDVGILSPGPGGAATVAGVASSLTGRGDLVSLMLVNNEVGTITPIRETADVVHAAGGVLHCDAVQAPVAMDLDMDMLGVDMMSLSGHKIGGPQGVGLLYVKAGTPWEGVHPGGGQERGRRGGTENIAGIVGMAQALGEQCARGQERSRRLAGMTDRLRNELSRRLGAAVAFNTPETGAAPHILNVGVPGVSPREGAEMLILGLDMEGIQVSAGSACSSGSLRPSHVLEAMGRGQAAAIRFSVGWLTTESEIDRAAEATCSVVRRVAALA